MKTYLINHLRIPGGILNDEGLAYLDEVEKTVKSYGGKWLAQGDVDVVEGAWPGSVVLMEFPSRADADNWYNCPEYQAILPLRVNNSIGDLILVESVGPDFTVAGFAGQVRAALAAATGAGVDTEWQSAKHRRRSCRRVSWPRFATGSSPVPRS